MCGGLTTIEFADHRSFCYNSRDRVDCWGCSGHSGELRQFRGMSRISQSLSQSELMTDWWIDFVPLRAVRENQNSTKTLISDQNRERKANLIALRMSASNIETVRVTTQVEHFNALNKMGFCFSEMYFASMTSQRDELWDIKDPEQRLLLLIRDRRSVPEKFWSIQQWCVVTISQSSTHHSFELEKLLAKGK
jgi:hypothetical protein